MILILSYIILFSFSNANFLEMKFYCNVNLSKIESDTSEIKDIVLQNLDEQTNLDDISQSLDQLNKNISTLKGQFTKLSNKIDETMKTLDTGDKND